jgi:hypothetical protein
VGPDRHRYLINVLATVVALNVMVGLVAVYARSAGLTGGWDHEPVAAETIQKGSILAGGNFTERRTSTEAPTSTTTTEAPTTTTTAEAATTSTSAKVPKPVSTTATAATAPRRTRTRDRTAAAAAPAPRTASRQERARSLDDPAGDTFVDQTDAPLAESRADIVRAGAAFGPGGIAFHTQVERPTDPRHDERWAGNSTFALWQVDTNGDTIADYEIRYFLADAHNVGGYVSRPGEDAALCSVSSATYTSDLYGVTVDPACLGNPTSFTFRASMYYETNPDDASATIATDTAPDKGWSPAIRNNG